MRFIYSNKYTLGAIDHALTCPMCEATISPGDEARQRFACMGTEEESRNKKRTVCASHGEAGFGETSKARKKDAGRSCCVCSASITPGVSYRTFDAYETLECKEHIWEGRSLGSREKRGMDSRVLLARLCYG